MKDEIDISGCETVKEVRSVLNDWTDYYNNDRYQWSLAKLSPNEFYKYIVRDMPIPQKRYTIMHEIGHIVLGHTESDDRSDVDEYATERFAIGVLAPACVLWGIGVKTADEIAELCNISITSAKIREKRMRELYDRNKFLTSPLERQAFERFSDFINDKKHNL